MHTRAGLVPGLVLEVHVHSVLHSVLHSGEVRLHDQNAAQCARQQEKKLRTPAS